MPVQMMTLPDALLKIQESTQDYFFLLMSELSDPDILKEPSEFAKREKYRRILDAMEIEKSLYQKFIVNEHQEKYLQLNQMVQAIIQDNVLNPSFYRQTEVSSEKKLLEELCQVHTAVLSNPHPKRLLNEIQSAATLLGIISEANTLNNPDVMLTLTKYKEAFRDSQMMVRDFFSSLVLSILHPLFILPNINNIWSAESEQGLANNLVDVSLTELELS
ncbi:MAG: hypothetical protein H0U75_02060 [Legionella sp.]|nr:hypothetical protein [Legionella sp.]